MATVLDKPKMLQPPTFTRKRKPAIPKAKVAKAQELPDEENLPETIHGKAVGSTYEARVALALDYLQLRYYYQFSVDYGTQRRGGQRLDFVVISYQPWTIVDVQSEYWHTGEHEDSFFIKKVAQDRHWGLVTVMDADAQSVDAAISFLRAKLPHG